MGTKITSLLLQFTVIPSCYGFVAAPNTILHHATDFACNFIASQIKFAFGVCAS